MYMSIVGKRKKMATLYYTTENR